MGGGVMMKKFPFDWNGNQETDITDLYVEDEIEHDDGDLDEEEEEEDEDFDKDEDEEDEDDDLGMAEMDL